MTYAKVMALWRVRVLEWDWARDTFPAMFTAHFMSARGVTLEGGDTITTESLLALRYPKVKPRQTARDLDRGAGGNWRQWREELKERTKKRGR